MNLVVTLGSRQETVAIEEVDHGFSVRVGERTYRVDRQATGPLETSLLVEGEQFEVAVLPRGEGRYWVSSRRGGSLVEVEDPLTHLARAAGAGGAGRRTEKVTAYMPGRVAALLVADGAEVAAGQGVVVLEAMKMENEIQVEHAGVIKRICVEVGQAVEGGDLLFELE